MKQLKFYNLSQPLEMGIPIWPWVGQMQDLVIDQLMSEKNVLTAEQQQRLFEMLRSGTGCDRGRPLLVPGRDHEGGIGRVLRTDGKD